MFVGIRTFPLLTMAMVVAALPLPLEAAVTYSLSSTRVINLHLDRPLEKNWQQWAEHLRISSDRVPGPAISAIGADQKADRFDERGEALATGRIHLLLETPLLPGRNYQLTSPGQGPLIEALTIRLKRANRDKRSSSIQTNQVGYLPDQSKFAYVGNWLGTLGPMPVDNDLFRIERLEDGKTAFEGTLALRAANDVWSGNDVWEADFSDLTIPGRYRMRVPGLGVSDPFSVSHDVHQRVFLATARLFFHSRNGMPISAKFADPGHARKGGIPASLDGEFDASVGHSPFGRGERAGQHYPVIGGWFDAGDYGQYITNAAPVWYSFGAALDLVKALAPHPQRLTGEALGIPESGNGVPDVLDELIWGFKWATAMQDSHDGGVYWRLSSRHWDNTPPDQVVEPRLIFPKTTHATASFAALAAIHARLLRVHGVAGHDQARKAAQQAWEFLENQPRWPAEGEVYQNPPNTAGGTYPDRSSLDNQLWAASELLRLTGEQRYAAAIGRLLPQLQFDPTQPVTFRKQGMAALWAILQTDPGLTKPGWRKLAREQFVSGANWLIQMAQEHPYRAPSHHRVDLIGWGGFAQSTRAVLPLLQAYRLTGKARYLDWAMLMPNPQLGANPEGRSFITGIGARPPKNPLSKLSKFSKTGPLRGIPVPGPHYRLGKAWRALAAAEESYLPKSDPGNGSNAALRAAYPALRRYIDADVLPPMSEATVAEYAQAAVGYGLLDALANNTQANGSQQSEAEANSPSSDKK